MAEKWIPWLYQYGVGGIFFFGTLWITVRCGALRLKNLGERWLLLALLGGFFGFLAIHGFWIAAVH